MQVLILDSDAGDLIWVADYDHDLDVAFAALFKELYGRGCYSTLPNAYANSLAAALEGDMYHIKALLRMRNGRPGETWRVRPAMDTRDYTVDGPRHATADLPADRLGDASLPTRVLPDQVPLDEVVQGLHNGTVPAATTLSKRVLGELAAQHGEIPPGLDTQSIIVS